MSAPDVSELGIVGGVVVLIIWAVGKILYFVRPGEKNLLLEIRQELKEHREESQQSMLSMQSQITSLSQRVSFIEGKHSAEK